MSVRIAVDIGGTFTDVVLIAGSSRTTAKLLTTYDHPGRAVLDGIHQVMREAAVQPADVDVIIHGTTLATNALIERRGAVTALLTTKGHRDSLEMAHEDRFEQYDINIDRPRSLVPRYLRLPIEERMNHVGEVLVALNENDVRACISTLEQYEVTSVAVGYLHAFVNPDHEHRTRDILSEALPSLSISLASEVAPEIREFERLSTACANAYVQPLVSQYLTRLSGEIKDLGFNCPFFLMTSGGGLTTLETAARFPIRLVESGPAGGAILAQHVANELSMSRLLSFDMGGTTAKLCLIDDGKPLMSRSFEVDRVYRFKKGSGLPVRIPVIEMVEIGAGGGSIAHIDKLGRLNVGPESAGSEPGPAAYGRGGERPTVTDADVVLGKIYAETFAGGAFALDGDAAGQALETSLAEMLDVSKVDAAFGLSEVVDENMSAAARAHAVEFGMDISARDIVAFGGAAPLHVARLGEKLGVGRIVIPTEAGVGSAVGFLLAPVAYEVVRSRQQFLSQLDTGLVNALFDEMYEEANEVVQAGIASTSGVSEARQAYMRYVGQGHELAVSLPAGPYTDSHSAAFKMAFEESYRALYGQVINGVEIEILSWTLTLREDATAEDAAGTAVPVAGSAPSPVATQPLFDPARRDVLETPVYLRQTLPAGARLTGPALITEDQTTTVVTSSYYADIDERGYIILNRITDDES